MKFLISHGQAIRSVLGLSLVNHFTACLLGVSVEVDVDEERTGATHKRTERDPASTGGAKRSESQQERSDRGGEHARPGVLEADGEDEAGGVDEEVAASVAQDQIPQQWPKQRRRRGCGKNTRPPFSEQESRRDGREHGRSDDAPRDCAPARHQEGSRPSSSARFLNSYSPSNSGAVSSSIRL